MMYVKRNMEFKETKEFFDNLSELSLKSLNRDDFRESVRQMVHGARCDLSVQIPNDSIIARDFLMEKGFQRTGV